MHQLKTQGEWDPFPPVQRSDAADRHDANRAIAVSAFGLAVTGVLELAVAVLSGSVGLLGDALHNLSDVSTSAVVWFGFRVSKRPARPSHPYGFERAEDLAGLGVALVIWASAVSAGYLSFRKLVQHGPTSHLTLAMVAAIIGMVGNLVVARYKRVVGRRIQSATLLADAKHSWLDAVSSFGALIGLVAVALGAKWGDPVAGVAITLLIVHVGWEVTGDVVSHLIDSVDPEVVRTAEEAANRVLGVRHAHVRARWIGRTLLVEVEGFVTAGTTVETAAATGRQVESAVLEAIPEARAVTFSPRAMPGS